MAPRISPAAGPKGPASPRACSGPSGMPETASSTWRFAPLHIARLRCAPLCTSPLPTLMGHPSGWVATEPARLFVSRLTAAPCLAPPLCAPAPHRTSPSSSRMVSRPFGWETAKPPHLSATTRGATRLYDLPRPASAPCPARSRHGGSRGGQECLPFAALRIALHRFAPHLCSPLRTSPSPNVRAITVAPAVGDHRTIVSSRTAPSRAATLRSASRRTAPRQPIAQRSAASGPRHGGQPPNPRNGPRRAASHRCAEPRTSHQKENPDG